MAVDPRIALGVQPMPLQLPNPNAGLNSLAQAMQIKNSMAEGDMNALKMQELQRGVNETKALNSLYATAVRPDGTIDRNSLLSGMATQNLGSHIPAVQKQLMEADTAAATLKQKQTEEQKAQLEMGIKKAAHVSSVLTLAKDPASYAQARAVVQTQYGMQLPEQYDPQFVAATIAQGQTVTEKLAAEHQRLTAQETARHNVVTEGETGRHNLRTEGIQGGQLAETLRHHGVLESQGAAALSKPFELTAPDGQAVLVQQDRQGNIAPVPGYAPKGGGKPLPGAALKQITEVRDSANTIDRLATSFKPEYAGKGVLGFGADAQLGAAGVLGADQDAVEWWKNYRKQAELVERHAMFGAALTPGEQASWRNADIGPGMDPKTIERNLKTRQALATRMLDTTRQDLIDAGHSEQRVNAIAGRGPKPASAPAAADPGIDALLKKYGGR